MRKPLLTQRQIRNAIKEGAADGETAANESHDSTAPDGGWDSWLINALGPKGVSELSGTKIDSPSWQLWLQIYHESACLSAENTLTQITAQD